MKPRDVDKWSKEKNITQWDIPDMTGPYHFCSCGQILKESDITNNVCKVYSFGVLDSVPRVYANVFLHAGKHRNATLDDHRIFRVKNAILSLAKSRKQPPVHSSFEPIHLKQNM